MGHRRRYARGYFVRRQGPDFKPKVNKKYLHMFAWMNKEAESKSIQIQHLVNTGQEYPIFVMGMTTSTKLCMNSTGAGTMDTNVDSLTRPGKNFRN